MTKTIEFIKVAKDVFIIVLVFWIVFFLRAQLSAKDATIEMQRENIANLEKRSAAHLVIEVEDLSRYVDESSKRIQSLKQRADSLSKILEEVGVRGDRSFLYGIELGSLEGSRAFDKAIEDITAQSKDGKTLSVRSVLERLNYEATALSQIAKAASQDEQISLPHLGMAMKTFTITVTE